MFDNGACTRPLLDAHREHVDAMRIGLRTVSALGSLEICMCAFACEADKIIDQFAPFQHVVHCACEFDSFFALLRPCEARSTRHTLKKSFEIHDALSNVHAQTQPRESIFGFFFQKTSGSTVHHHVNAR